jgi:hypothetical protein
LKLFALRVFRDDPDLQRVRLVFDRNGAGNPLSMHDSDGMLPDDVPVADAVEQQRPTADSSSDEDYASPWQAESDVPLEATAADWQEQQESVLIDPEYEEPNQANELE